jgi:hypothetical protein
MERAASLAVQGSWRGKKAKWSGKMSVGRKHPVIPEVGHAVRVRNRLATVRAGEPGIARVGLEQRVLGGVGKDLPLREAARRHCLGGGFTV